MRKEGFYFFRSAFFFITVKPNVKRFIFFSGLRWSKMTIGAILADIEKYCFGNSLAIDMGHSRI